MYIKRDTPKPTPTLPKSESWWIITDPDLPDVDCEPTPVPTPAPTPLTPGAPKPQPKPPKSTIVEPLPQAVINERTMVFRMDSRTLWTKYALGLVNYAVSDVAALDTTPSVEERMFKASTLIGDFFVPYYGIRAGSEISRILTEIFMTGTDVVATLKRKGDIVPLQTQWAAQTKELSELFNKLNPGQYPTMLLQEMFTALTELWTDNIKARITKNTILNAESIDGINKLVITGIANHVNKGYQSLADVLSRGVIAQYPSAFLE